MKLLQVKDQPDYFKLLLYGDPDAGKTTLAASGHQHPDFSKTLIVNIEGGLQSIRWHDALQTPKLTSPDMLDEVLQGLINKSEQYKGIKTVVIDSITALQQLMLDKIVAEKIEKKGLTDRDTDDVYLEDYGQSTKKMRRYAGLFRDLECNVIVTALARYTGEDAANPVKVTPDLTGKAASSVMGIFDCVWALKKQQEKETGKPYVMMLTQAVGPYAAKTRNPEFANLIGAVVKNPTLPDLWHKYKEALIIGQKTASSTALEVVRQPSTQPKQTTKKEATK